MSQEIEHFENRIAKVEEFIRHNRFLDLVQLVQQLQESLKVVRDLSFFEKQKQRIEKFDKMIQQYLATKEKEFVFDTNYYRQNHESIKALLFLEQYFKKESQFLDQLIELKLLKDFDFQLNNYQVSDNDNKTYIHKFFLKFSKTLVTFLEQEKQFLGQIFSDIKLKHLHKELYEKLLQRILQDYKEKLINEFVNSLTYDQQVEVYEQYFITMLEQTKIYTPIAISYDGNMYSFSKDLYQELLEKYRKQVDQAVSENFEFIQEKDSITSWERNFEKVIFVFEKVLVNNIEICQCFEMQFLIQTILKSLEKFLMQLCYHISQFSSKKIHFGTPNPDSQFTQAIEDSQQLLYEQKFKWQSIFDYLTLHYQALNFFESIKTIDKQLISTLDKLVNLFEKDYQQKRISAFIAQKNTTYFKQLQRYLSPQQQNLIFSSDQPNAYNIEQKVFKSELLDECIKVNLLRTFSMIIFKELNNINMFPLWKQILNNIPTKGTTAKTMKLMLPEAGDYIRKIGEHFISFIHKLDSASITQQFDQKFTLYQKYCLKHDPNTTPISSSSEFWICEIGKFLCQTISSKYMKINSLSPDGEKQMIADIIYLRKLITQFCNLSHEAFDIMDSILIGLLITKKNAELSSKEILELPQVDETLTSLIGREELDKIQINENVLKALQVKRKN